MNGKYAPKMWKMLTCYGVESSYVKPYSKKYISMEALEQELEAADDFADNEDDINKYEEEFEGLGTTTEEDDINNDLPNSDEELSKAEEENTLDGTDTNNDDLTGEDDNEDYGFGYQEINDTEWDNSVNSIDDTVSEADAINMVQIITNHTNQYVSNIELIEKDNQNLLERTGDIKQAAFYNEFIQPANTILNVVFKDTEIMRKVNNFLQVLEDKRKMSSICGTVENPFLYEGIQLLAIELYKSLLAIIPFYVKNATSLEDTISSMKLDTMNTLIQMVSDVCEVDNMFGTKIFYVAPVVSDVTGKSEEVAGTPYANLESCTYRPFGSKMMYAGESIMNLVEIKNNKALPEYSILSKMMKVISGLCVNVNIMDICKEVLDIIKNVLNSGDSEDANDLVYDACETLRKLVFIPQIEKIADMNKQEEADAVGSANPGTEPDDMSSIVSENPDEPDASVETNFYWPYK